MTRLPDDEGCGTVRGVWKHVWGPWLNYGEDDAHPQRGQRRFCFLCERIQYTNVVFFSLPDDPFRGESWRDSLKEKWQDDA